MSKTRLLLPLVLATPGLWLAVTPISWGAAVDDCIAESILRAEDHIPLSTIRQRCESPRREEVEMADTIMLDCLRRRSSAADSKVSIGTLKAECRKIAATNKDVPEKFFVSRSVENNPYVISPLYQNYILPYTFNNDPNQEPYRLSGDDALVDQQEAKLQISLQIPLTFNDLFTANDGIYFGFTLKSFWQVYNDELSAPFRETNYRPEIFYLTPLPIESKSGAWFGRIGVVHESNGRTQFLSRSWNRAYVTLAYARENWGIAFQPWYRFPEDEKFDDGDPDTPPPADGDDNPDIEDYMGNFELTGAYRWKRFELSGLVRRNFEEGHGAYELGLSFPIWGRLRGYVQYFEGYGESLIDYDHKNQRIGVGILLTGIL